MRYLKHSLRFWLKKYRQSINIIIASYWHFAKNNFGISNKWEEQALKLLKQKILTLITQQITITPSRIFNKQFIEFELYSLKIF